MWNISLIHFRSVQLLSPVSLWPWTAAHQAFLSITPNSRSLLKFISIKSVMPSNHLILCCSLLILPSIFPSIRVFSKGSVLHIRWPEYWSFSFNIPMNSQDWFPLWLTGFKAMVFPIVMYGCESWTIKKAEHWRIDVLNCGDNVLVNTYWVSDLCWVLEYFFVQDK